MKVCGKCEYKNGSGNRNCTRCGTMLNDPPTGSKKRKGLVGLLLVITVLTVVVYIMIDDYYSPEYAAEQIMAAIDESDARELSEFIMKNSTGEPVSIERAEAFIDFLKKSDHGKEKFRTYLRIREQEINRNGIQAGTANEKVPGARGVSFERTGDAAVFFDAYQLVLEPVELVVETDQWPYNFMLEGNTLEVEQIDEGLYTLGKYYPGIYNITISSLEEYINLTKTMEVNLFNDQDVELSLGLTETEIHSDYDDAELTINGTDTGIILMYGMNTVGPVLLDGSMTAEISFDTEFGTLESEPIVIDSEVLHFDMDPTEFLFNDIVEAIHNEYSELGFYDVVPYRQQHELLKKLAIDQTNLDIFQYSDSDSWNAIIMIVEVWMDGMDTQNEDHRTYKALLVYDKAEELWKMEHIYDATGVPLNTMYDFDEGWIVKDFDVNLQADYLEENQ